MKRLILFLIAHCSLFIVGIHTFGVTCYAQSITWQKWYDGPLHENDGGLDMCSTTDGNFVIVGSTIKSLPYISGIYVLKINAYGDTIWTRILDGYGSGQLAYSVAPSNDGGCVLTGDADTAFTAKLNSSGDLVWYNRYGDRFVQCYKIIKARDGGYIACGREVNATIDGYVLKIDSSGGLQWKKVYPSLYVISFKSITQGINNGYVLGGFVSNSTSQQDTGKTLIFKIDSVGNIEWSTRFKAVGETTALSIDKISSGYVLGGYSYNDSSMVPYRYFIKVGINGNIQNYKLFTSVHQNDVLTAFKTINDNKYAMVSDYDTNLFPPVSPSHITLVDSLGNILIDKVITNGDHDIFSSIVPSVYGNIFWIGQSRLPAHYWYDVYVVRSDSNVNFPPVGIKLIEDKIPNTLSLYQNYPNPFNPSTTIKYDLPKSGNVTIKIYDLLGREIYSFSEYKQAGSYNIKFDGSKYASGLYFYRIEAGGFIEVKKMVLIK